MTINETLLGTNIFGNSSSKVYLISPKFVSNFLFVQLVSVCRRTHKLIGFITGEAFA